MPLTNAPFILSEVEAALQKLIRHDEPTVIYLSQIPMTEDDTAFLRQFFGEGDTVIEMEGLSRTVFRETRYPAVWWGEYYSAPDKLSLRTLEVAEVPELVLATREDIRDGLKRLIDEVALTRGEAEGKKGEHENS